MSHPGRTGSPAARQAGDELHERLALLQELVEELAAFPAAAAPRAALRHRLRTLQEAAEGVGHAALVRQVRDALFYLQRVVEHGGEPAAADEHIGELRASIAALRDAAEQPLEDAVQGELRRVERSDTVPDLFDPRSTGPIPKGFHGDLFFESESSATEDAGSDEASAAQPSSRPIELTQTVAGVVSAPSVAHVLVVDEAAGVERIRNGLPQASYEVVGAADDEQAMALLRAYNCEVVLVTQAIAENAELNLVQRIRGDAAGSQRRVLLLAPRGSQAMATRHGCDAWVRTPVEPLLLDALLERLLGRGGPRVSPLQELTEGTVDDVARRLTDEIRRGLTETLQVGRDERISLDDPHELLAAAWSAIGRVRTHLSQRSMGKVRFADPGQDLLDAAGPNAAELVDAGVVADTKLMAGQRVLLADDDPAVLWFFAGLLREAGAVVFEAKNGREALELAHKRRPHLIISDILMPKLDGFALCRELKRAVSLWDVPVILLSWKEDFLLRMRELQSGAVGYLRKEAGSRQILTAVADALRPRARLRARLSTDDKVSGRIDLQSVCTLIELAAERGNVAIQVRDAYNLYEIQICDGEQIAATRTATDGSFCRGPVALRQALAVRSGRFEVTSFDAPLQDALDAPLTEALRQAECEMTALLEAVSGGQLLQVGQLEFDEALLALLAAALPASATEVVALARDEQSSLRDRIISGDLSPHVAEEQLVELVRAGAVLAVRSVDGENMVEEAFAEVRERMTAPASILPLPPEPVAEEASETHSGGDEDVEDADAILDAEPAQSEAISVRARRETEVIDTTERDAAAANAEGDLGDDDHDLVEVIEARKASDAGEVMPARASTASVLPLRDSHEARSLTVSERVMQQMSSDVISKVSFVLTMAALGALGYSGVRLLSPQLMGERSAFAPAPVVESQGAAPHGEKPTASESPRADEAEASSVLVAAPGDVGRLLPSIDRSKGVKVAENEGLLAVECGLCEDAPTVRVGEGSTMKAPTAMALPEGRHEMVLSYDGRTQFRYVVIVRGQTRVVDVP